MDLILDAFARKELEHLSAAELDCYDALLHENDQDLYAWVTGQTAAPVRFAPLIKRITLGISAKY